jgi:hypothetical protein
MNVNLRTWLAEISLSSNRVHEKEYTNNQIKKLTSHHLNQAELYLNYTVVH